MGLLAAAALMFVGLFWAGRAFVSADPAELAKRLRLVGGIALVMMGLLLSARGLFFLGVPLLLGGVFLFLAKSRRVVVGPGGETDGAAGVAMTPAEAADLLGVAFDARPDEIKDAHARASARIHLGRWGGGWRAAQLDRARDVLLNARAWDQSE